MKINCKRYFLNTFLLLVVFCCALVNNSTAQNVEFTKDNFKDDKDGLKAAVKAKKEGDNMYDAGTFMYSKAVESFLKAQEFNPNNAELNFRIGHCYLYSIYKLKAIPYLEKAFKLDPGVDPEIHFLLGRAYQLNLEFPKAKKEYEAYAKTLAGLNVPERIAEVTKKIKECKSSIELLKKPVKVFIDNLGTAINSKYPEYGPAISADESVIIFTSKRDISTGGVIDPRTNQYFEDIYIATKDNTTDEWNSAVSIGEPVNTEGNDASLSLSPDGQKLFIYIDDGGNGNIYECVLKGDKWGKPHKLNSNVNSKASETFASISPDGKKMYFVSQREGGKGGRDIYVSTLDKKEWGEAVNLGPVINTEYDEDGVFIHPDGKTLYFSSQGHNSMGGYDIFKSVLTNGKWSVPENLGYPINTSDDDVDFVMAASGRHGYYSSIKSDTYGEKDIYMITFLADRNPILGNEDRLIASLSQPVKETKIASAVSTAQLTLLRGTVTDDRTKLPIEATIELVDNSKNEVIASFTSNSATGKYLVSLPAGKNYGIAVKADGYLFHSENFDIPNTADFQEIVKDIALNKLDVGSKIVLNNIFFDFGKASLRPESTNELERLFALMNDNPTLKIEISGHTDNKGSAAYNQPLSENRARAVVDYLVKKGIPAARMEFKGYGFTQPIATNDTDEGRQQNRRTEFKILSK